MQKTSPRMDHYMVDDFHEYILRLVKYGHWGAAQGWREGKSSRIPEVLGRPLWRFFRTYILQLGILDGLHGLVVCGLQAFGVFLKYARLWEYRVRERLGEEIVLPAFDEDDSTWQHPDSEGNGGTG